MRFVRFSSFRLPPCRLTVVYVRTTSPNPALSMYGTSARLRMIFLWPWLTRLLTLSLRSSSPSPRVILPFMSSTTTSPTFRSSMCMKNAPEKCVACELITRLRRGATPCSIGKGRRGTQRTPCARRGTPESTRIDDRWRSDAASARKLAGLEAFLAEHGAPLGRLEGHRRLLPTRRTVGDRFHPFPRHAGTGRASRAL